MAKTDKGKQLKELRRVLDGRLRDRGQGSVSDALWESLVADGDVVDALEELVEAQAGNSHRLDAYVDDLADEVEWRLEQGLATPGPIRRTIVLDDVVDLLTVEDYWRSIAASWAFAMTARTFPFMQRFRERELGGQYLTTREAHDYLLKLLPPGRWPEEVDPDPEIIENVLPHEDRATSFEAGSSSDRRDGTVSLAAVLGKTTPSRCLPGQLFVRPEVLDVPTDSSAADNNTATSWYSSSLYRLARRLVNRLPWREEQAVWHILTGLVPYVSPVSVTFDMTVIMWGQERRTSWGRVFPSHEPWISTASRKAIDDAVHRALFNEERRSRNQRTLQQFVFASKLRYEAPAPAWKDICSQFNEQYPNEPWTNPKTASTTFNELWRELSDYIQADGSAGGDVTGER